MSGGCAIFCGLLLGLPGASVGLKVIGGLFVGGWLIGCLGLRQFFRTKYLREFVPGAAVWNVGAYSDQFPQINSIVRELGATRNRMWPNSINVLVAETNSVRVYGGMFFGVLGKPKLLLSLPSSAIVSIQVTKAQQGTFSAWCIELGFDVEGHVLPWDICVIQFRLPIVVPRESLIEHQKQLQIALAAGKDGSPK
jgi:hypothetical protein